MIYSRFRLMSVPRSAESCPTHSSIPFAIRFWVDDDAGNKELTRRGCRMGESAIGKRGNFAVSNRRDHQVAHSEQLRKPEEATGGGSNGRKDQMVQQFQRIWVYWV